MDNKEFLNTLKMAGGDFTAEQLSVFLHMTPKNITQMVRFYNKHGHNIKLKV